MKDYIRDRVLEVANYTIESKSTIRDTAKKFGVSKSTIHKDLIERLPVVNNILAENVRTVIDFNIAERNIRGGESTKRKYQSM